MQVLSCIWDSLVFKCRFTGNKGSLRPLQAEQSEDMTLETGGFRECGKSRGVFSLADSADVFAARGEVVHQGV